MMNHPKAIGDRTTLAVMLALDEAGYRLLVRSGRTRGTTSSSTATQSSCVFNARRGGCGRAVRFAACSTYGHHFRAREARRSYHGQIDSFAVYCPDTGGVYLVPIADLPNATEVALRVDPPRNNQRRRIRFAADYEVGHVSVGPPK